MSHSFQVPTLAMAIAIGGLLLISPVQASFNCEITQCRGGGNVPSCWAKMQREARVKSKSCGQLVIGSGVSAYAMALSLPKTCIKSNAVIKIHRPYFAGYRTAAIGSHWHNYYFGRIKPSAVNFFRTRGGMKRDGFANAAQMVGVPAAQTGLKICK